MSILTQNRSISNLIRPPFQRYSGNRHKDKEMIYWRWNYDEYSYNFLWKQTFLSYKLKKEFAGGKIGKILQK
jgi:hypothetical protein